MGSPRMSFSLTVSTLLELGRSRILVRRNGDGMSLVLPPLTVTGASGGFALAVSGYSSSCVGALEFRLVSGGDIERSRENSSGTWSRLLAWEDPVSGLSVPRILCLLARGGGSAEYSLRGIAGGIWLLD